MIQIKQITFEEEIRRIFSCLPSDIWIVNLIKTGKWMNKSIVILIKFLNTLLHTGNILISLKDGLFVSNYWFCKIPNTITMLIKRNVQKNCNNSLLSLYLALPSTFERIPLPSLSIYEPCCYSSFLWSYLHKVGHTLLRLLLHDFNSAVFGVHFVFPIIAISPI